MATSTIQNPNRIESTDLGSSSYTAQVTYYKRKCSKYNGNRVHIELSCLFNIDIPTSTVIASVPEGYRPKTNIVIPAIIQTDVTFMAGTIVVNANGLIEQGVTAHFRSCVVDGWYDI